MEVLLDIPEVAEPIINKTRKIENKKASELKEAKLELDHLLNEFILLVEGFYNFIPTLHKNKIKNLLDSTIKVVPKMDGVNERLRNLHYLHDTHLEEKFNYALKALYKLKAMLHVAYYKGKPILKTPDYIKKGLANISLQSVSKTIISD